MTAHGERLLVRARRVAEEMRLVAQDAAVAQTGQLQSAVIGLPLSVGPVLAVPLTKHLFKEFPEIKLRFVELASPSLQEWLDSGRVDLAVLYRDRTSRHLTTEPLVNESLHLIASTAAPPLAPTTPAASLKGLPMILPSKAQALRHLIENAAAARGVTLNVLVEVEAFVSAVKLVAANIGYAVLPATSIRDEVMQGGVAEFENRRSRGEALPDHRHAILPPAYPRDFANY